MEFEFSVAFSDGCLLDELSNPSSIEDFNYYIAATGIYVIDPPTFSQLVPSCEILWSIVAVDDGSEAALSTKQD